MTAQQPEVYYVLTTWNQLYEESAYDPAFEDFQTACMVGEEAIKDWTVMYAGIFRDDGKRAIWVKGFGEAKEWMKQTRY